MDNLNREFRRHEMGVITVSDVDYGRIYGPFPALGNIPQSHFIGYLTSDERHEIGHVKINLDDVSHGNTWLPYVNPARHVEEQNMEAYLKDGHVFYRALRIIRAAEELLVWYSKDFAQILEIPFKTSAHIQDGCSSLTCEYCGDGFCYIFPLMAHIRFKCNKACNGDSIRRNECNNNSTRQGMAITNTDTINLSAKRCLEGSENEKTTQKIFIETMEENTGDENSKRVSAGSFKELNDIGSAFRKVEKSISRNADNYHDDMIHVGREPINVNDSKVRLCNDINDIARHVYKHVLQDNSVDSGLSGSVSMLMNSWHSPSLSPTHRTYINHRPSLSSISNAEYVGRMNTFSHESFRNIQNADMYSKQLFLEQLRKSQLPCVQTINPIVDKILQTTPSTVSPRPIQPLNLAQNWCAKCNSIFRMTSDLVYHMRSHHKREFDPVKRKREGKLQCHVCKETFKEKHHLTRHLTSHT